MLHRFKPNKSISHKSVCSQKFVLKFRLIHEYIRRLYVLILDILLNAIKSIIIIALSPVTDLTSNTIIVIRFSLLFLTFDSTLPFHPTQSINHNSDRIWQFSTISTKDNQDFFLRQKRILNSVNTCQTVKSCTCSIHFINKQKSPSFCSIVSESYSYDLNNCIKSNVGLIFSNYAFFHGGRMIDDYYGVLRSILTRCSTVTAVCQIRLRFVITYLNQII